MDANRSVLIINEHLLPIFMNKNTNSYVHENDALYIPVNTNGILKFILFVIY